MQKTREYLKRYFPLEIVATITAISGALVAAMFTENAVIIAFAGTWGDNFGYYGTALVREIHRTYMSSPRGSRMAHTFKAIKNVIFEFGPAESTDSFIVRPFFMYLMPKFIGDLTFGTLVGKITADAVFYTVTIYFYEMRKKHS